LSLFLFSLLAFLQAGVALADTGPKPSMDFQFQQEMTGEPPLTIISGILYECDQPDCSDAAPLEEGGPQGFTCAANSCYAVAYGFAPYHQLEIEFSDGNIRRSHVFETAGFDSKYTVTIRPGDLLVESQFSFGFFPRTGTVLVACICGLLGIVVVIGLAVLAVSRARKT
jgi:hypothetical protein